MLRDCCGERNKKPSWCWDSQPSVGFFGIFLIFGSNTPTWSVENQLNLWATNCVVNQTGYFGPLYTSRHQTSLWRHQHIYSVQLPQTGQPEIQCSISPTAHTKPEFQATGSFVNTALLMPQITPHNPRLQVAYSEYCLFATLFWRQANTVLPLLGGDAPRLG